MTSVTFYRLTLFLPYLTLIPGYFLARDFLAKQATSGIFSAESLGTSWLVMGVFWIIPYTLMILGLLIWSRDKSSNTIRFLFLRSPFILTMVVSIVFVVAGLLGSYSFDPNIAGFLGATMFLGPICSAPFSIVIGYIFVAFSLLIYQILNKFGYIKDEN